MMRNALKIFILSFLVSLSLIQLLYAEDTPYRLYVVGKKEDSIKYFFQNGIIAPGINYNLMDLLSGNAFGTTAYNTTFENLNFFLMRIGIFAAKKNIPGIIIYTIRPSQTFYNVDYSLQYSILNTQATNPELSQRLEILLQNQLVHGFRNWVTNTVIPAQQIESATVYQRVGNTFIPISTFYNQNYVPGQPSINPAPISITNGPDEFIQYGELDHMRTLPGEFCGIFSSPSLERERTEKVKVDQICSQHTYSDLRSRVMNYLVAVGGILF